MNHETFNALFILLAAVLIFVAYLWGRHDGKKDSELGFSEGLDAGVQSRDDAYERRINDLRDAYMRGSAVPMSCRVQWRGKK